MIYKTSSTFTSTYCRKGEEERDTKLNSLNWTGSMQRQSKEQLWTADMYQALIACGFSSLELVYSTVVPFQQMFVDYHYSSITTELSVDKMSQFFITKNFFRLSFVECKEIYRIFSFQFSCLVS